MNQDQPPRAGTSQEDLPALWRQGEAFARQRQPQAALRAFEAMLALDPDHAMALLRASRMALSLGRYRDAHRYAMRALQHQPGGDEPVIQLARMLRTCNEFDALLQCAERSRWRERRSAAWLTEMAMLVSTAGDNPLAMRLLDLAVKRDPAHPPTRYFRGVVKMYFGDTDGAQQELERCIALAPHFAQAHWVLSRLRRRTPQDNHVDRARAQLGKSRRGGNDEVYLAFALHNELHDLGRFDEAWQALEHGCRCRLRQSPHDRDNAALMFDRLRQLCDARFVQSAGSPTGAFVPIFIVGMYRSGSTLLEQLLGGHPSVTDGGESHAFTAQMRLAADYLNKDALDAELAGRAAGLDFARIGEGYLQDNAARAQGRSHLTEKLPSNFLNLGFIARALPQARFVHMVRDPLDTCFSNLRTLFTGVNGYSYDQRALAQWYGQYRELMAHWHRVMPGRLLDVPYPALVTDTEAVMRQVLAHCGLPWHGAAAALDRPGAVATASSPQMRGGILQGRTGDWAPYAARLQPLIEGLKDFR